jgi:histidyl-tRNA synthetase
VKGLENLKEIERIATEMGIKPGMLHFAPNLTRGLNYYTGVLFETFMPNGEKYGSIASGGRYDNLVGAFNPRFNDLQGIGGSIGLSRLFAIMKGVDGVDLSKQTTAKVFVGYRTANERDTAVRVASALRAEGIFTELLVAHQAVKKQLGLVDDKGIPYAILVMNPDEIVLKETHIKKTDEKQTPQHTFKTIDATLSFVKKLTSASEPEKPEESKQ